MPYFIHFYPYISYKVTLHFKSLTISPHSVATALFLPLHHRRRGGQRLEEISFITSTRIPCSFIFSISFTRWPWEELVVRSKYFLLISPYYVFFFFFCHCSNTITAFHLRKACNRWNWFQASEIFGNKCAKTQHFICKLHLKSQYSVLALILHQQKFWWIILLIIIWNKFWTIYSFQLFYSFESWPSGFTEIRRSLLTLSWPYKLVRLLKNTH